MRYVAPTIAALALFTGCIRERAPAAPDAGSAPPPAPLAAAPPAEKPDAAAAALPPPAAPEVLTIEQRLRRCDPSVTGAVVRVSDDVAYAAEAGPVVRAVRRAGGEFVCERYEAAAGAASVAWAGPPAGRVLLATAVGGSVGAGSTAFVEVGPAGAVRGVALLQGACAPGSTVQAVRLFEGAPSVQVRCWIATEGFWTAVDQIVHRTATGWETLTASESGRVVRSPTIAAPPANPTLPGSIRVVATGESPRLEVATSSVDAHTGSSKFARQSLVWNAAERRFQVTGTPVVERRGP